MIGENLINDLSIECGGEAIPNPLVVKRGTEITMPKCVEGFQTKCDDGHPYWDLNGEKFCGDSYLADGDTDFMCGEPLG